MKHANHMPTSLAMHIIALGPNTGQQAAVVHAKMAEHLRQVVAITAHTAADSQRFHPLAPALQTP